MKKKTLLQLISVIGVFVSIGLAVLISVGLTKLNLITRNIAKNKLFATMLICIIYAIWCWVGVTLVDKFYKEKEDKK